MVTPPVPVMVCDACGTVEPLRLKGSATQRLEEVTEQMRLAELAGRGWTLTDRRDLCPTCVERGHG